MSNVISMEAYRYPWHEALTVDGESSSLQVYIDDRSGDVELIQTNDDGKAIRIVLNTLDVEQLFRVMVRARRLNATKRGVPR